MIGKAKIWIEDEEDHFDHLIFWLDKKVYLKIQFNGKGRISHGLIKFSSGWL